jgi:hypothetical protein
MRLYYQCGIEDSTKLLAEAGETMMPAAQKMCDIYGIKNESISAREVIKVRVNSFPTRAA